MWESRGARSKRSLLLGVALCLLVGAAVQGCARKHAAYPSGGNYRDGDPDAGPFVLENTSVHTICYVSIRPTEQAPDWGPDQLDVAEVLRTGSRRSWHLPAGRYDIRLEDCNRRLLEEATDLEVSDDGGWFTLHDRAQRGG